MKALGYGLIGSGFMGRCHAQAMNRVAHTFAVAAQPRLELSPAVDTATAEKAASVLGFARAAGIWKALIADPAIDIASITAPNTPLRNSAFHFRRARFFPVDQRHPFDQR
jgi:predicted dehydrogenase